MTDHRINCPVVIPSDKEMGKFANAFRIRKDSGSEWLLDFLVYSENDKIATVVARIRVSEGVLEAIYDRVSLTIAADADNQAESPVEMN